MAYFWGVKFPKVSHVCLNICCIINHDYPTMKIFKNKKAQASMGEYGLALILVISAMGVMGIYFKRAIQARIHDSRNYMVKSVFKETAGYYDGNLYIEYEPYYLNTISNNVRNDISRDGMGGGGSSGIATQSPDEFRQTATRSVTAPPRDADTLQPVGVK